MCSLCRFTYAALTKEWAAPESHSRDAPSPATSALKTKAIPVLAALLKLQLAEGKEERKMVPVARPGESMKTAKVVKGKVSSSGNKEGAGRVDMRDMPLSKGWNDARLRKGKTNRPQSDLSSFLHAT